MDLGSLLHAGVEAFHRKEDGVAAIEAAREKFPAGDAETAKRHLAAYCADEANRDAEVVRLEEPVYCRLPDPFGGPTIVIRGTLDQVRRAPDGRLTVHDVKSGNTFRGLKGLYHYSTQQAAYTVGATQTWGERHHPGSLICTASYFARNGVVHEPYTWTYEDCEVILAYVATILGAARRGNIGVNPREEVCHWCPHKSPTQCLPKLRGLK